MWHWVLGVNLGGVVNGCVAFLPLLLAQDEGHVVNTASLAGLGGIAGLGVYCTSKFAVVGLTESLHHELAARGANVHASVVCPGFVQTRIGESHRNMPDPVRGALGMSPAVTDGEHAAAEPVGDALGVDLDQQAVIGAGIPAADVADAVFAAVRDEQFWVLPHHRAARTTTASRLAWMVDGTPTEIDLMAAITP
jgi:NAD(P)-dependent dehydrogenase (short-subunit alcohol dehydrogenase family)